MNKTLLIDIYNTCKEEKKLFKDIMISVCNKNTICKDTVFSYLHNCSFNNDIFDCMMEILEEYCPDKNNEDKLQLSYHEDVNSYIAKKYKKYIKDYSRLINTIFTCEDILNLDIEELRDNIVEIYRYNNNINEIFYELEEKIIAHFLDMRRDTLFAVVSNWNLKEETMLYLVNNTLLTLHNKSNLEQIILELVCNPEITSNVLKELHNIIKNTDFYEIVVNRGISKSTGINVEICKLYNTGLNVKSLFRNPNMSYDIFKFIKEYNYEYRRDKNDMLNNRDMDVIELYKISKEVKLDIKHHSIQMEHLFLCLDKLFQR